MDEDLTVLVVDAVGMITAEDHTEDGGKVTGVGNPVDDGTQTEVITNGHCCTMGTWRYSVVLKMCQVCGV